MPEQELLLNIRYNELCAMIHDPNYDVAKDNYHIVEYVRDFFDDARSCGYKQSTHEPLIEDMLLRVRNVSSAVFAITVGQFPGYDYLEDRWKERGYVDITGFTWLAPT